MQPHFICSGSHAEEQYGLNYNYVESLLNRAIREARHSTEYEI